MHAGSSVSTWSDATAEQLVSEIVGALVRILLRSGIPADAIAGKVKEVLVQEDVRNISKSPVLLGAVQRDCMEVMCRWRRDPMFLSDQGLPSNLPIQGQGATFELLCARCNVSCDPEMLVQVLVDFGAIARTDDQKIAPLTPTFLLGAGGNSLAVDGVLKQITAFLRVIEHNIQVDRSSQMPRFERMCTVAVARELLPVFERLVRERGQEFIDGLDEWLERHRQSASASGVFAEVGAGAYFVDLGNIEK